MRTVSDSGSQFYVERAGPLPRIVRAVEAIARDRLRVERRRANQDRRHVILGPRLGEGVAHAGQHTSRVRAQRKPLDRGRLGLPLLSMQ